MPKTSRLDRNVSLECDCGDQSHWRDFSDFSIQNARFWVSTLGSRKGGNSQRQWVAGPLGSSLFHGDEYMWRIFLAVAAGLAFCAARPVFADDDNGRGDP